MKNVFVLICALVTILTVFSTNVAVLKDLQVLAVWIMLSFLGIGLIGYVFNWKRIIFAGFGCCAILCVFLKSASNTNLKLPEVNNDTKISVGHVNVTSADESYQSVADELVRRNLDIISFQEVKPDWSAFLKSELSAIYPYILENVRIDPFGMAIYSKYPIVSSDTLFRNTIPVLKAKLDLGDEKDVTIFNSMVLPSINKAMDSTQLNQLNLLQQAIIENSGTELVLGDFNMVYWSSRIREFRENSSLLNSRRDVSQAVLLVPYDHIFHTGDVQCTMFKDMIDSTNHRLGIYANFQFFNSTKEEL